MVVRGAAVGDPGAPLGVGALGEPWSEEEELHAVASSSLYVPLPSGHEELVRLRSLVRRVDVRRDIGPLSGRPRARRGERMAGAVSAVGRG